jgi:dienelactone hydrolase
MILRLLCILPLFISPVLSHAADEEILAGLHEQVVQVPVRVEGLFGAKDVNLTATVFRPDGDGPFPLVVLSHGTPPHASDRVKIGRFRRIPQIRALIKRGFAVIVPIRRGHGATGGDYAEDKGRCNAPVYFEAGRAAGRDVVAAVDYAVKLPYVNPDCVILVGQSSGGFASLAAASMNPRGLIAVVNFSGGHGGDPVTRPGEPCDPQSLAATIAKFSQTIKVPVLWHYAENDRFFSPKYVREWYSAFEKAGGKGRLVIQPPFGEDGHRLFNSRDGIPIWTREFDSFLRDFNVGGGKCGIPFNR